MEFKAELHCHCDGVVDPAMLREFTHRGEDLERTARALEEAYPITSLERWLRVYEPALSEFWRPLLDRMRLVATAQRDRWRSQNVRYAELFISRVLGAIPEGEPLREWFRALAVDLELPSGHPEVNLVICLSRGKLAQHVGRIIDLANAGLVAGVALAGDEFECSIRDLQSPLGQIHDAGIGIEIHAGEIGGPASVRDALNHGRPDRIGHGVRAFEDSALVERIARENVHLEFCPTSNLRLGVIRAIGELPVDRALAAGVEFSINTDDPGVFQCTLTSELRVVQETFHLTETDMERIFRSTIRAGFRTHNASSV